MRKIIRRVLTVLLAAALVFCLGAWGLRQYDYHRGRDNYQTALELAGTGALEALSAARDEPAPSAPGSAAPGPEGTDPAGDDPAPSEATGELGGAPTAAGDVMEALAAVDLAALQGVNPAVIGWVIIPHTGISYPLVQGTDNQYYLSHTWSGSRNPVGAIFMEEHCSADFSDFNTILYGHQCRDKSMFGLLSGYKQQSYLEAHPSIYVRTADSVRRYDVFAAYEGSVSGWSYRLEVNDPADQAALVADGWGRSVVDTGEAPALTQVLTLSTCTGHGYATRWVVQGMLAREIQLAGETL